MKSCILILLLALYTVFLAALKLTNSILKRNMGFIGLFLVLIMTIPLYFLIHNNVPTPPASNSFAFNMAGQNKLLLQSKPDIYHIILDGYGRSDVLQNDYHLNNSDFISYLNKKGFIVRKDFLTNYQHTQTSVASLLTGNYLEELPLNEYLSGQYLIKIVKMRGVAETLKNYGYSYFEISSWLPTKPDSDLSNAVREALSVEMFFPGVFFFNLPESLTKAYRNPHYDLWRMRLLEPFNKLKKIACYDDAPKYVFCHSLMTHPPFVFGVHGEAINSNGLSFLLSDVPLDEYRRLYPQQLIYTNQILEQTIDTIISKNRKPFLIIISADHGPRVLIDREHLNKSKLHEAIPIFFAYRPPTGDNLDLRNVKTPINLYRAILNHYFGERFALLPDRHYFAEDSMPLQVTDITKDIQKLCQGNESCCE